MDTTGRMRGRGLALIFLGGGSLLLSGNALPTLAQTPPVVKTRLALDALGDAALSWQNQFDCSGCHKQSMTIAALGNARASGYEAARPGVVDTLLQGMLTGASGQGADGCFSFQGQSSFTVATSFGGRGLEAHQRHFGDTGSNLIDAADCLLGRQAPDGRLASDHTELPVAQGDFVTTSHGVHSWDRAFEISGSSAYANARDQAISWLRSRIGSMETTPASFTAQDKAMLLAGLGRAGAGTSDADVVRMRNLLASEQLVDGSWMLSSSSGGGNAHATGQVAFAMRSAGYDRTDPALDLGVQWLLDNQQADGLWPANHWQGGGPSDVAPSMWAAMALATFPSPLNRLTVSGGADAVIEWPAVEGADSYDLIQGFVSDLFSMANQIDLGSVQCLAPATPSTSVTHSVLPAPGEAFFYLMRIRWGVNADVYGRSGGGLDRVPTAGDCPL